MWVRVPSEKLLIASIFLCLERYANVASGDPSLIIRCTVIKLLNTTVHVESRSRFCSARNTSATPASPECVAIRICSMYLCKEKCQIEVRIILGMLRGSYFVFGGAAYGRGMLAVQRCNAESRLSSCNLLTLIFVAPFTDFSKELAISTQRGRSGNATAGGWKVGLGRLSVDS